MSERAIRLLLLLSVTIVSLVAQPAFSSTTKQLIIAGILGAGALLACGAPVRRSLRPGWPGAIIVALVACQVIALFRFASAPVGDISAHTADAHAIVLIMLTAFVVCALWRAPNRQRIQCTVLAPVVFTGLNLLLYIGGVRAPVEPTASPGLSSMLSMIGISFSRTSMPLVPGLDESGGIAAVSLVITVILASRSGITRGRRWLYLAAAASMATILMSDARAALLFAVLTLLILWALPRAAARTVSVVALILPVMSAAVLWSVEQLAPFASSLNRNPGDFRTATGRSTVWSRALHTILHPANGNGLYHQLVGYGFSGQVRSGVSYQYAYLFSGPTARFHTVHNLALQIVLDQGLIGLVVLMLVSWLVLRTAANKYIASASAWHLALVGGIVCLLLLGSTAVILSPLSPYLLAAMIILCVAAIARSPEPPLLRRPPTRTGIPDSPMNSFEILRELNV